MRTVHASGAPQARETRDVQRYLHALHSRARDGALIEVRYRHRGGMRNAFFQHTDTTLAARTIVRLGISSDVYVGVAPRRTRHGGKHAISEVWALWADLDDVDAHQALEQLPVAPAILIASGTVGHLHAYFPLRQPVSILAAEAANRRLAAQLGADTGAVTNAATILRPPGTYSFKTSPPAPVQLERLEDHLSTAAAVTAGIAADPAPPATVAPAASTSTQPRAGHDPLRALDPAHYVSVLTGQVVGRSRKIHCPFHDLSVGEAAADGVSPARSAEDASSSDRRASSDRLLLVAPPVYFKRLTGLRVGPSGKLHCLFHDDRSPSLHVYREPARGWYCFGCGRGGSVYDLAALLLGRKTRGRDFCELRRELEALLLTG